MLSYRLLRHSVLMVRRNFGPALKVCALPLAVAIAAIVLNVAMAGEGPGGRMTSPGWLVILGSTLALFVAIAMAAISWHRYILLEEPVRLFFVGHGKLATTYILTFLLISIVAGVALLVCGVVAFMPLTIIADGLGGSGGAVNLLVLLAIFAVWLYVAAFIQRLAMGLPAVALDRENGIGVALAKTKGFRWTFIGLAFLFAVFRGGMEALVMPLASTSLPIYLLAELGLNWFFFMLGLSLLTTLYGYFVEERSLA